VKLGESKLLKNITKQLLDGNKKLDFKYDHDYFSDQQSEKKSPVK
jgi:hypothetical protein